LRQYKETLDELRTKVFVVTFEPSEAALAYVRDTDLPWPVLIDEQRTLYRAYGMERGSRRDTYSLSTIWAYLKLMLKGRLPHRSDSDIYQKGGDVLIDSGLIVRLHHVGSTPADRPPVERLIETIRKYSPEGTSPGRNESLIG